MATPRSLLAVLARVPDPRSRHGRRHPRAALLALAGLAMLPGAQSYQASAPFGRDQGFALAHPLGCTRGKTPAKSTSSGLFRLRDVSACAQALARWAAARRPGGAGTAIALDGKTARGSRDGEVPGPHRGAASGAAAHAVPAQVQGDAKANAPKAALPSLGIVPVRGTSRTGDALPCPRDRGADGSAAGGACVFTAKDNQPSLAVDIRAGQAFPEQAPRRGAAFSPGGLRGGTGAAAGGRHRRHGAGRIEERTRRTTSVLTKRHGWAGLTQGCALIRERARRGVTAVGGGAWPHPPQPRACRRGGGGGGRAGTGPSGTSGTPSVTCRGEGAPAGSAPGWRRRGWRRRAPASSTCGAPS